MISNMKINDLQQFEDFLKTRIPSREALFMGDIGLKRARYFMKLLGNPQNKLKVVHVAGTSGKGSTAYLTSHILQSQGFKVGLSISPHIFDIRERMQIDNALPDKKLVLKYFNQILPIIQKMERTKYGSPTFFEINVGLAFHMFAKEKVDYAVMETGLGGTLDATNTATSKNKICIITKIGLDHTEILGKTVSKIAGEKAGIIQKENTVISLPAGQAGHQSSASALNVIKNRCLQQNADLQIIGKKNYSVISSTPFKTVFDFQFIPSTKKTLQHLRTTALECHKMQNIQLGLIGKHQAENCCLALACLFKISMRDKFKINVISLRKTLSEIKVPGRMEIRKIGSQKLIIDGAHNPQKMDAFISNLSEMYPNEKFTFLVAFKKSKDFKSMLKKIIPLADKILLTQFSTSGMDNHWSSTNNETISRFLKSQKFNNFLIVGNKKSDIINNIKQLKKPVVITGSLYFIGSIYPWINKRA